MFAVLQAVSGSGDEFPGKHVAPAVNGGGHVVLWVTLPEGSVPWHRGRQDSLPHWFVGMKP